MQNSSALDQHFLQRLNVDILHCNILPHRKAGGCARGLTEDHVLRLHP